MDWSGYECEGQMSVFDLMEDDMKEITRITTIQITQIMQDSEQGADYMASEEGKSKYAENLKHRLDVFLNADDVKVTNVQVFVREE